MHPQPIEQHRWVVQVEGHAKTVHDRTVFVLVGPDHDPMTARTMVRVQVDDVALGTLFDGSRR